MNILLDLAHYMKVNKITNLGVVEKTGYSASSVSQFLTGKKPMPDKFIKIFKKVYPDFVG